MIFKKEKGKAGYIIYKISDFKTFVNKTYIQLNACVGIRTVIYEIFTIYGVIGIRMSLYFLAFGYFLKET